MLLDKVESRANLDPASGARRAAPRAMGSECIDDQRHTAIDAEGLGVDHQVVERRIVRIHFEL